MREPARDKLADKPQDADSLDTGESSLEPLQEKLVSLQIAEFEKLWYHRPSLLIGIIAAIIASLGVFGQGILTKIQLANSDADLKELQKDIGGLQGFVWESTSLAPG